MNRLAYIGLTTLSSSLPQLMQHLILQIPAIFEKQQDVLGGHAGGGGDYLHELFDSALVSCLSFSRAGRWPRSIQVPGECRVCRYADDF